MIDLASVFGIFGAVYGIVAICSLAVGLVFYLLQAFGIYGMSKKLGLCKPWLCFVPIINTYSFGSVAESYKLKSGKKPAKLGIWLLVLNILQTLAIIALLVVFVLLFAGILGVAESEGLDVTTARAELLEVIIPFVVVYFITFAVSLTFKILRYVALWRIYDVFSKNTATLFLILSFLFPVLEPIFLVIIRNNPPMFNLIENFEAKNNAI